MPGLRSTHKRVVSAEALSTTIAEVWDPAAGKRVRLMGVSSIYNSAADPVSVAFTDGTAVNSGTVAIIGVSGDTLDGITPGQDLGDALTLALDAKLGMKTVAGIGTVSLTLLGREEPF